MVLRIGLKQTKESLNPEKGPGDLTQLLSIGYIWTTLRLTDPQISASPKAESSLSLLGNSACLAGEKNSQGAPPAALC